MNAFIQKHADSVIGVVSGFDRLVLRGTIRSMAYAQGLKHYLDRTGVLLKDFGDYAEGVTKRVKAAVLGNAEEQKRPVIYLPSGKTSKEDLARQIASRDRITSGLVCVLTSVESCPSFEIFRNRDAKKLELRPRFRKCLHLYQYLVHEVFGLVNVRIQSWLPLNIQVCLNGREWLARQMDRVGIRYRRADNTFTWIEDYGRAQRLMDHQLRVRWPRLLGDLAAAANPAWPSIFGKHPPAYYWSVYQSEWATDVGFRTRADLEKLYPSLIHHGMLTFSSPDVMRFLGRPLCADGTIPPRFTGEVVTDIKRRVEGVRIKHRIDRNSIKGYDKGPVFRAEVTINDPYDFKVFRPAEGDPSGDLQWRPMRRGIADLHRRAEVSEAANHRYLEALASVEATVTIADLVRDSCAPVVQDGTRVRALNPWAEPDLTLLTAVNRGEFTVRGFRNKDLRPLLYSKRILLAKTPAQLSAATTRRIRLLRAHGLITKLTGTHRYQLTQKGRLVISALLITHNSSAQALTKLVA